MYAIFEHGGHQYRGEDGATLRLSKIEVEPGNPVTFDKVLFVGKDGAFSVGTPYVAGATVKVMVLEQGRGPKLRYIKYKRKKHYKKQGGHRQDFTAVRVDQIVAA